jgi:uncharacterized damage-inducible protein DinB
MHEAISFCQANLSRDTMNDYLSRLIAHMRWADHIVADALADDSQSAGESVRLFGHIAAVEHVWYNRIVERPAAHAVWPDLALAESRLLAAEHADLFEALIRDAADDSLARMIAYRNSAGRSYENSVSDIIIHTAMHGEHHRGQIARLIRAAGREPPYTDYIQYARRNQ